jgi:hypothetical protein
MYFWVICLGIQYSKGIGQELADTVMWLKIAQALAVFRISKVVEGGVEITPEGKYTSALVRCASIPLLSTLLLKFI